MFDCIQNIRQKFGKITLKHILAKSLKIVFKFISKFELFTTYESRAVMKNMGKVSCKCILIVTYTY
jgi:hypothetical protein